MGKKTKVAASQAVIGSLHSFGAEEIAEFRKKLLAWYDENKRILPWRTIAATETDFDKRAYAVWVSEMMLQQTQVATVISYFEKWMTKWPTVRHLAEATLEEVNQVWAGLGYYSRARRLHEGAIKMMKELDGHFPHGRDSLVENLPGVGRYSGSAIASIAMNSAVGVVDGNVNRVLTRIRAIGSDIASQSTTDHIWSLSDEVVDPERPGDFNQAIMELGATVCTPKTPSCASCPLQELCIAYKRSGLLQSKASIANHLLKKECAVTKEDVSVSDIECLSNCDLCLRKEDWDVNLGVQNYPRKASKQQVKEQTTFVVILQHDDGQMLLLQRPKSGLLANLWEFPSILQEEKGDSSEKFLVKKLSTSYSLPSTVADSASFITDVVHVFSHIRQTYKVYKIILKDKKEAVSWPSSYQMGKWMTKDEFITSATSTAMKKVLKAVDGWEEKLKKTKRASSGIAKDNKKQKVISQFFSVTPKQKK